jgi:hypothetical protein
MADFNKKGIFNIGHEKGIAIRNVLRKLDSNIQLNKIPPVYPERKAKNTNWYFIRTNL